MFSPGEPRDSASWLSSLVCVGCYATWPKTRRAGGHRTAWGYVCILTLFSLLGSNYYSECADIICLGTHTQPPSQPLPDSWIMQSAK